ncbi:hypothetical protein, variant 7 [Cryptococcus amylolentus CBS 6039]|uniref:Tudor domain-containing protein n=1 Tax=Cryptococcus amylolentus CBS 6039 TaxID=1295533 RepID=A0A1E3I3M3_9TREE|nr:hypothetical protein, variant 6 [Cryptococcus amylolentus CBS 6039]XP_018997088.1 hypothetical protein, variant 7 [Cryptococcus amylolentus CBS 6039]ODN83087.1 hypothetical protein, variant 6 [Cryptococcus amylolentus CBS 6039]ODN83088.1 hypothetical protein, variant 7 [Cryptococcus amylolentus CBS 6039]
MDAELQTYKDQLAYVNLSLESDATNDDLLKLKTELVELIDLTEQAMGHSAGGSKGGDTSAKGKAASKGKEKEVTNWQDQARVNAVVGSQESPLYTITFKGYTSSTNVPLSSLRPHDPNAPIPQPQKRKNEELTEKEKEKKKKKGDKWMETQKQRADEVKEKKNAWEKFGKKATKKGIHISGLEGKSVFRTPDNPYGRGMLYRS